MENKTRKTIKELPEDERPREKLLKYGADRLSDIELFAILLRTGTKGKSAIDMADEILKSAGGLFKGLAGKNIGDITKISGTWIQQSNATDNMMYPYAYNNISTPD